jgi:hypothetical protein
MERGRGCAQVVQRMILVGGVPNFKFGSPHFS